MRKISIIAALVILYNSNTFAMLHTFASEDMGLQFMKLKVGNKGGELKCIANLIESGLEKYDTYEKSNPVLAKSVLKGSLVLAKGIVGVIASRSPMGFLGGIATGTVQELQGVFVSGLLGHSLNNIVNKVVDTTAPWLMKLDPLLDVREAKILACAVMGASMTLCEFGAVGKIVRCSTRPKGTNFAFFEAEIEQSIAHNIKESIVHNIKESFHTLVHGSMSQLQEESLEKLVLQGSQAVTVATTTTKAESASEKLLEQSKQDLGSFLAEILQEQVHEDVQKSHQIGQLEKRADQSDAMRQIQELYEKERENIRYQVARNTIADTCEGFSAIMSIAGNHKEARQIATLGHASIKFMDSCRMLSAGTSAVAGIGSATMATSCIAPYAGIACAVASLVSLFDDESDGLGEALGQINQSIAQMHQSLSQQISTVHTHMMERFDHLEDKVDSMDMHVMQGFLTVLKRFDYLEQKIDRMDANMIKGFVAMAQCFQKMSQQMQDSTAANAYAFEHINSDLQAVHQINAKVDSLLLNPFVESCSAIERYPSRFGKLSTMDEREVVSHYKILENTLLGINPACEYLNGHVCADFSPITMNRILAASSPASLLGYLAKYSTSQLGISLPRTVEPARLPNLNVFVFGLEKYLALRRATTHIPYDDQCKVLQDITHVGDHALTFIRAIQGNTALFEKLYAHYKACQAKVLDVYCQVLAQKSQELCDVVFNDVRKNTYKLIDEAIPESPKDALEAKSDSDCWVLANGKYLLGVDLERSMEEMLIDPGNRIFNVIIVPKLPDINQFPVQFPLNHRNPWVAPGSFFGGQMKPEIESCISNLAILAQRLGLGFIEIKYVRNPDNTISVEATFRKKDNIEFAAGGLLFDDQSKKLHSQRVDIRQLWSDIRPSTPLSPYSVDDQALKGLVAKGLAEHRRAVLDSLLAPTALGISYQQAAEELNSAYHAIKAFATIAG